MNIYHRIVQYAPNWAPRFLQFLFYSIISAILSAGSFVLFIPMLEVLFKESVLVVPPLPEFAISKEFFSGFFRHYMISISVTHGKVGTLLFICLSIVSLNLLANAFRYAERMAASRIKMDVVKNMRMHIFERVSLMHLGFFNNNRKGDLISRFTNDVGEVEVAVVNSLKFVLKEPITIIVYLAVLFTISVKLTLFAFLVLPIMGYVVSAIIKKLKRKAKQSQQALGRIVTILDETFSGMRVIKAFNARNFILDKIDAETSYHRKVNLSISRKNELAGPISEILGAIIVSIIIYYGGNLVLGNSPELKAEQFLGFLVVYASMIQPAKNFSNGITSLQKGTVAATRIFEVVDTESEIQSKPGALKLEKFTDKIEFRNVSFAYDNERTILKNINLTIEKGKTIALVGPSGGGKSTLADLVPRFYDPTAGAVMIDGHSLTEYELESLRHHIGVVTQESILFNDTIFNNIAFGMPDVKKEDVIHAAKVANAHDFILQSENGYDTIIGERGSKLSGGQRQRLSIARAVLKNPAILILDEATSALDSESERLVQDALNNLMKNRTSIVIAHRLSTIQHADEIIVIQQGEIAERGSHEALSNSGGLYKKLTEIQKV
ncbi:MAG TPA: ABC transporter ATP-binding protein [Ohtaekwangia sp.]